MSSQGVTIRGEEQGSDPGAPKGSETEAGTKGASTRTATATPTGEKPEGGAKPEGEKPEGGAKPEGEKPEGGAKPEGERPSWLPEKFKSPEDLAKAYGELEKKQSAGKPEGEKPEGEKPKDEGEEAPDPKMGSDFTKNYSAAKEAAWADYKKDGKVSDETYAKFDKIGLPRADVNASMAGQIALKERAESAALDVIGGREAFDRIKAWGSANLSEAEQGAYNRALDRYEDPQDAAFGDVDQIRIMMAGLKAKYEEATGREPNRVSGEAGGRGTAGPKPFKDSAEVKEAMRDPRYKKSEAYRQEVARRLAVS